MDLSSKSHSSTATLSKRLHGINSHGSGSTWERVESAVAVGWTLFIAVAVAAVGALGVLIVWIERDSAFGLTEKLLLTGGWLIVVVIECVAGRFTGRALERPGMLAVDLALEQSRCPRVFRFPVAVWWMAHVAASLVLGQAIVFLYGGFQEHDAQSWLMKVLSVLVTLSAAAASNLYVLLAVSAMRPRREFVQLVWRLRWAVDIALTTLVIAIHGSYGALN
jgi:hypothetical protein